MAQGWRNGEEANARASAMAAESACTRSVLRRGVNGPRSAATAFQAGGSIPIALPLRSC